MVLPRYRPQILLGCRDPQAAPIKQTMEMAIRAFQDPKSNPAAKEELLHLSQYLMKKSKSGLFSPRDTGLIPPHDALNLAVTGCLLAGEPDLDCDIYSLSDHNIQLIGAALDDHGLSFVQDTYAVPITRSREAFVDTVG